MVVDAKFFGILRMYRKILTDTISEIVAILEVQARVISRA